MFNHYVSHVRCHVSCVIYIYIFFSKKYWSLLVGGLSSTGLTCLVVNKILYIFACAQRKSTFVFLLLESFCMAQQKCIDYSRIIKKLYNDVLYWEQKWCRNLLDCTAPHCTVLPFSALNRALIIHGWLITDKISLCTFICKCGDFRLWIQTQQMHYFTHWLYRCFQGTLY